ncbi:MAG: hypothetical protein GX610_14210, partial [Rhodococcus sp.]|nr:hypothetical protein [Rhodococcus sp. (in: high G+C Gram-positive bacteria)]
TAGSTQHLTTAGRLLGLIDRGTLLSTQDQFDDEAAQEQAAYSRKSAGYDAARAGLVYLLGPTPVGSLFEAGIYGAGDPLKQSFIGPPPGPAEDARLNPPELTSHYLISVAAAGADAFTPETLNTYGMYFDQSGQLLAGDELLAAAEGNPFTRNSALFELFNRLGYPGNFVAFDNAYDYAVMNDG